MSTTVETTCVWCGCLIEDPEEAADPYLDDSGDTICHDCHREYFTYDCCRCEEDERIERRLAIGSLVAILRPVECSERWDKYCPWYDYRNGEIRPGIYRIVRWPVYTDGMICGWLHGDAFEWFCKLPQSMENDEAFYPMGLLCVGCQWWLKHLEYRPERVRREA